MPSRLHPQPPPPTLPKTPTTRLSSLLSPPEAVQILGPSTCRHIIRAFLRSSCQQSSTTQQSPSQQQRSSSTRYRHPLEEKESNDEKREIDLLLNGLLHDFTHDKDDDDDENNIDEGTKQSIAQAWTKLSFHPIHSYPHELKHELEGYGGNAKHVFGGGISTHSANSKTVEQTKTTPIITLESLFSAAVHRTSSVLGLDKSAFLTKGSLFPPTTVPDRGPNGHMALMDCVFNALSTPPPETEWIMDRVEQEFTALTNTGVTKRSVHDERMAQVLAAGRGKSRILLPDLIIVFAICRLVEWDMEYRGYLEERREWRDKVHEETTRKLMELEERIGDGSKEEQEEEEMMVVPPDDLEEKKMKPPPREDGLHLASLLAFRIYDGYQRQNTLTRDTLQRFLSDIHGEDSYKTASVKSCLDKMFEAEKGKDPPPTKSKKSLGSSHHHHQQQHSPISKGGILSYLDTTHFSKGIHATISYSHRSVSNVSTVHSSSSQSLVAMHILLDWIILLFNCMLPRQIPPPSNMAQYYLRIVNADPVRMLDTLSIKYGLYDDEEGGHNGLYEIRRRFSSLQKKNGSMEKKKIVDGEADENRATLEHVCPETGELIVPEESEVDLVTSRPKNVVDESSFVTEVSTPNAELGHGGYLPAELARLTFRACANLDGESKGPMNNLWGDQTDSGASKQSSKLSAESYWTLYDAVSFGCQAVRWEALQNSSDGDAEEEIDADAHNKYDSEMPLLQLAFKTFQQLPRADGKSNDEMLDRRQIGKMLLLLLEHESFRLEADSPPSTEESDNSNDELDFAASNGAVLSKSHPNGSNDLLSTLVDVSYASLLGLVPPKLDLSQYTTTSTSTTGDKASSTTSLPLHILVDYVILESKSKDNGSQNDAIDFEGFVQWHLRLASDSAETRLGPYLLDLKLIAAVLFGIRPASPKMEKYLVDQIKRRHKYRYPRTRSGASQPRGPKGTVWFVINADWWRLWDHYTEGKMSGTDASGYVLGKIDNNMLLSEEGILSLKQGLHWQRDFQLVEPLVWSALQAWHDGGPPIPRYVVPFNPQMTDKQNHMSYSPTRSSSQSKEEYEIELYPLYATVFLCDKTTQGEPRPFQQFVPLSRYLPLSELVDTLRDGLGKDITKQSTTNKGAPYRPTVRLWMMNASSASMLLAASSPSKIDDSVGWILDTDLPIGDERNMRDAQLGKDENVCLMLELRNEDDGSWPRSKPTPTSPVQETKGEEHQSGDKEVVKLGDGIVGMYNMG